MYEVILLIFWVGWSVGGKCLGLRHCTNSAPQWTQRVLHLLWQAHPLQLDLCSVWVLIQLLCRPTKPKGFLINSVGGCVFGWALRNKLKDSSGNKIHNALAQLLNIGTHSELWEKILTHLSFMCWCSCSWFYVSFHLKLCSPFFSLLSFCGLWFLQWWMYSLNGAVAAVVDSVQAFLRAYLLMTCVWTLD